LFGFSGDDFFSNISALGPMGDVYLEQRPRKRWRKVSHDPTYKAGDLIHVVGNSYLVVRVLGAGGMGAVYWCIDKELDEPRVLKVLHPSLARERPDIVERFLREARAIVKIRHDNIVRVIGLHRVADPWKTPCFSMEALEGHSLTDAIKNGGMEVPHRALHVLYQTLAGLAAMHARGVVHRDIKPGNLFLFTASREDVLIKILDLGVIRLMADETVYEGFIGTFGYASDRQLSGKLAEPEDDVFAAMLVCYECLTGSYAFEKSGQTKDGAVSRIGKRPPPLRDHGLDYPDLEEMFEQAFDPDPSKRFKDAMSALRVAKKLYKKYAEGVSAPIQAPSTTQDRPGTAEPITHALLSPTRPDTMPAWLEEFRKHSADAPVAVRVADSEVDERGPTTPSQTRGARRKDDRRAPRSSRASRQHRAESWSRRAAVPRARRCSSRGDRATFRSPAGAVRDAADGRGRRDRVRPELETDTAYRTARVAEGQDARTEVLDPQRGDRRSRARRLHVRRLPVRHRSRSERHRLRLSRDQRQARAHRLRRQALLAHGSQEHKRHVRGA
jgi:serine/threonine protein kinase